MWSVLFWNELKLTFDQLKESNDITNQKWNDVWSDQHSTRTKCRSIKNQMTFDLRIKWRSNQMTFDQKWNNVWSNESNDIWSNESNDVWSSFESNDVWSTKWHLIWSTPDTNKSRSIKNQMTFNLVYTNLIKH